MKRFSLSLACVLSFEGFISSAVNLLPSLQSVTEFLWTCFALIIFGLMCYLGVKPLDQSSESIFKFHFKKEKKVEFNMNYISNHFNLTIVFSIIFTIIHIFLLITLFYGIYNFPFYYGGQIWNYYYNNNSTDMSALYYLIQTIYSAKAFFTIGVGAFLDKEIETYHNKEEINETKGNLEPIYDKTKKIRKNIFSFHNLYGFIAKYQRHFFLCK